MFDVKILGLGCSGCIKLKELIVSISVKNDIDIKLAMDLDITDIIVYKIKSTPAVVVNEKLVCMGVIPTTESVEQWFK